MLLKSFIEQPMARLSCSGSALRASTATKISDAR